ncbi:hypothetical protein [Aestuariimicrobium ganziense]|uniref:hypothetical protein n=1 Tax=Aestuariimicrobium ganziense TaxID=2773677 RepID=UPI00194327B3|nr:hypothetical protein [Aestuariimicrobium ganziense]
MDWLQVATVAVVLVIGLVTVLLGGRVVDAVFKLADRASRSSDTTAGPVPTKAQAAASQLRGGAWIGMLERLAIYAALLSGYPEGMALALAVKGLARYPELKATQTGAAERFIIGTFVSVLVACAAAGLAWWVIHLW